MPLPEDAEDGPRDGSANHDRYFARAAFEKKRRR